MVQLLFQLRLAIFRAISCLYVPSTQSVSHSHVCHSNFFFFFFKPQASIHRINRLRESKEEG